MKFCPVVPEICRGQVHGRSNKYQFYSLWFDPFTEENLLLNADLNAEYCFGLWLPNQ
jgi:hypothetical protein